MRIVIGLALLACVVGVLAVMGMGVLNRFHENPVGYSAALIGMVFLAVISFMGIKTTFFD